MHVGRFDEALRSLDLAMQRNSYPPSWVWDVRGGVLFHMRRYDEAIEALCNVSVPQRCSPAVLAAAYVQAGRIDEAYSEIAAFRAVAPNTTISDVVRPGYYADPTLAEPWIDALRNSPVTKSLSDHPISGAITTTSMAIWPSTVAINTSASVSSV